MLSERAVGNWNEKAQLQPKYTAGDSALIIQKRDGSLVEEPWKTHTTDRDHYYAEIAPAHVDEQASLVERIIVMAFDVLGAHHLEVRVQSSQEGA